MVGAMQVEANLHEQLNDHLNFRKLKCAKSLHMLALTLNVSEILQFKMFDRKMLVKVIRYKYRNGIIHW